MFILIQIKHCSYVTSITMLLIKIETLVLSMHKYINTFSKSLPSSQLFFNQLLWDSIRWHFWYPHFLLVISWTTDNQVPQPYHEVCMFSYLKSKFQLMHHTIVKTVYTQVWIQDGRYYKLHEVTMKLTHPKLVIHEIILEKLGYQKCHLIGSQSKLTEKQLTWFFNVH